ncbi:MAG: cytochrome c3 family protein [Acidobacteriota bacterium]|nr:cytochrome c3 family protein [Acidobacteriota bacterium]
MLRAVGAELCLACHGAGGAKIDAEGGTITLLDRFQVKSDALRGQGLSILQLSADGKNDHPVTNHRVLGTPTREELALVKTSFEGEFTCLTCHDPHKGRSAQLFRWNAEASVDVCKECHDK